jgi:hypothetical protein
VPQDKSNDSFCIPIYLHNGVSSSYNWRKKQNNLLIHLYTMSFSDFGGPRRTAPASGGLPSSSSSTSGLEGISEKLLQYQVPQKCYSLSMIDCISAACSAFFPHLFSPFKTAQRWNFRENRAIP